jgi:hypothetical protein
MAARKIRMSVRANENEAFALQEICAEQNVNLSVLLRECTLSDFSIQQVSIRTDDVFNYSQIMYKVSKSIEDIINGIYKNSPLYSGELSKIKMLLIDINSLYVLNYRKIEKARKRISKLVASTISKSKDIYYERYLEPSREKLNIQFTILLSDDEHNKIKEQANIENVSISSLLKNNVFKKCVKKKSLINSYSLDSFNNEINKKAAILSSIALKANTEILDDMDIENILSLSEKIKNLNKEIDGIILTEQKDIRREANKILRERRG